MQNEIKEKLDRLAEIHSYRDYIRSEMEKVISALVPEEIQKEIDAVRLEFLGAIERTEANVADLQAEIKVDILNLGESVKGDYISALFVKGRSSWDSKRLDGYATAYPEVLQFKKVGKPSVTIRFDGLKSKEG